MQTALGVRDAVMKFTEVMVYVSVYFTGALLLVATSDRWLMLPLMIWLAGYAAACWYFVPKLGKLSAEQADMRSLVTGPRRGQLYQHPDGEAFRPCRPRGFLCQGRHGLDARRVNARCACRR
jgi:hypothetical protein